jgi:hypothetical protein
VAVSSAAGSPAARGHVGHAVADLVDHAGDVVTGRLRELGTERERARAELGIGGADAGRAHPDAHLAGAGMRVGQVDDVQDLGAAEPAELGCLHDDSFR